MDITHEYIDSSGKHRICIMDANIATTSQWFTYQQKAFLDYKGQRYTAGTDYHGDENVYVSTIPSVVPSKYVEYAP